MKKILLLLMFLLIPSNTFAQEDNLFGNREVSQEEQIPDFTLRLGGEERVFTIVQGQPSPVSGTVFNTAAVAWLQSQIEYWKESYRVHLNYQLNQVRARARLEISTLELQLETERESNRVILATRDLQISTLTQQVEILTNQPNPTRNITNHRRRIILVSTFVFLTTATISSYVTYKIIH